MREIETARRRQDEARRSSSILHAGDSVLGPRGVSHAFAFNGEISGRLLITYALAGRMEEYFNSRSKDTGGRTAYVTDAAKMAAFGMELRSPDRNVLS